MKKIVRFETVNRHRPSGVDVWTVIDKVPEGWIIWNIGAKNSPEGYVPIVKPLEPPEEHRIDINNLCAIRSDHVVEIMKAASWAFTLQEAKELLEKLAHKTEWESWEPKAYYDVVNALPYIEELWEGRSDE